MGDAVAVGRSEGPRLALTPAGQGRGRRPLVEPGQDLHVFAFEIRHHATFSARSFFTATHSASISLRATSPFSTSGPDLPTVTAAM